MTLKYPRVTSIRSSHDGKPCHFITALLGNKMHLRCELRGHEEDVRRSSAP